MQRRIPFGVQWQPNSTVEPIPLEDLVLDRGNWQISPLYMQIQTAKEWGLTPYEYFDLPLHERMLMVGYSMVSKKMEAYEHQYNERQSKAGKVDV